MSNERLSVREIREDDIDLLVHYWYGADHDFLKGMGVDTDKMPLEKIFRDMLMDQLSLSYPEKQSYCIIWLADNKPIGHSNINKIVFEEEASMHLHLWNNDNRQKGMGSDLLRMTIPYYFKNYKLKKLYCEPYALNPAPNRTLEKIGFQFIKEYITTPGYICFEQPVSLWEMNNERFLTLYNAKP